MGKGERVKEKYGARLRSAFPFTLVPFTLLPVWTFIPHPCAYYAKSSC
jgi:hypothetical protein